ncbi:unnamed protein product [Ambrosiozyma monospora]|uniref:Unnamed protein product n=1 Tax=Ambrosiozyma monospora TaxID=43982 RepID=A0A9W6Z2M2_AMBMO|nr:unnamed protein product [Ambrosiozyma monospora]
MSTDGDASVSLGKIIYIAVKPIFKIYLIVGVGFWLAKKNILTVDASRNISNIVMMVLVPCLAFTKIVTNISNSDIAQIGSIAIISFFMMFGEAMLVFIVGVLVGCPRNWWGGLIACGLLPNIGDLPIAYLQGLQDSNVFTDVDKGVSYVFIYVALQFLVQFNLGGFRLIEMDFKYDMKLKEKAENDPELALNDPEKDTDAGLTTQTSGDFEQKSTATTSQRQHSPHDRESDLPSSISSSIISVSTGTTNNIHNKTTKLKANDPPRSKTTAHTPQHPLSRITSAVSSMLPADDDMLSRSMFVDNDTSSRPPEDVNDIVKVYSRYDQLSKKQIVDHEQPTSTSSKDGKSVQSLFKQAANLITFGNLKLVLMAFLRSIWQSTKHPVSMSLIVSITVCMIPWVKALFVETKQAHLSSAPDGLPPLSFFMDFTSYIGAAQVPFGLLLLGGTIGRLKLKKLPKGLWRTPVSLTVIRLFVFPVIGCALNSKIHKDGLFYNEDILYFLSNINFCMPPATTLLYLTAMYTPVGYQESIQMDCLALAYIFHYICLVVCLPFTTSYTMKVSLGY